MFRICNVFEVFYIDFDENLRFLEKVHIENVELWDKINLDMTLWELSFVRLSIKLTPGLLKS